jgi:hypothetical protein
MSVKTSLGTDLGGENPTNFLCPLKISDLHNPYVGIVSKLKPVLLYRITLYFRPFTVDLKTFKREEEQEGSFSSRIVFNSGKTDRS